MSQESLLQSEEKTAQVSAEKDNIAQQAYQDVANLNERLNSAGEKIIQYKAELNQCKEDIAKVSSEKEKALEDICSLNEKLADADKVITTLKNRYAVRFLLISINGYIKLLLALL